MNDPALLWPLLLLRLCAGIPARGAGLVLVAALGGCTSLATLPPDTNYQSRVGRVAVVAAEQTPELDFEGFAHGTTAAASAGGGTFVQCLSALGSGGCSGDYCGAALLFGVGVCGIFGLVSGVAGAVATPPAATLAATRATLARSVEARAVQESLRRAVEAVVVLKGAPMVAASASMRDTGGGRDFTALAGHGIDTVLETALTAAGTEGGERGSPATAYMQVRVRLVNTHDNAELHASDFRYEGRRLTLAAWSADGGRALQQELDQGFQVLGAHIYDYVFDWYAFPDQSVTPFAGVLSAAFGLAPVSPATRVSLSGDNPIARYLEWTGVDSVNPVLNWQSFPRKGDVMAAPADMDRVRNVTYDLVIAEEDNLAPAKIVYRRDRLPAPKHRLETALQPSTRYFWTVRARFDLDGRSRVTEWGSTHFAVRQKFTAPSVFSYRFRTP